VIKEEGEKEGKFQGLFSRAAHRRQGLLVRDKKNPSGKEEKINLMINVQKYRKYRKIQYLYTSLKTLSHALHC